MLETTRMSAMKRKQLSGICPAKAIVMMFLFGPFISFILGMAIHYLAFPFSWLNSALWNLGRETSPDWRTIGGAVLIGFLIIVAAVISGFRLAAGLGALFIMYAIILLTFFLIGTIGPFIIFVAFPILIGIIISFLVLRLAYLGHCRNTIVAGWAGVTNGIFVYAVHIILGLWLNGNPQPMTLSNLQFLQNTAWTIVAMATEFVLITAVAYLLVKSLLSRLSYCETHNVWYPRKWKEYRLAGDSHTFLDIALQNLDASWIEKSAQKGEIILLQSEVSYPHLAIEFRACPASPSCDWEMRVKRFWQETKKAKENGKEKESKPSILEETKYHTMIPAEFGQVFEKYLQARN